MADDGWFAWLLPISIVAWIWWEFEIPDRWKGIDNLYVISENCEGGQCLRESRHMRFRPSFDNQTVIFEPDIGNLSVLRRCVILDGDNWECDWLSESLKIGQSDGGWIYPFPGQEVYYWRTYWFLSR